MKTAEQAADEHADNERDRIADEKFADLSSSNSLSEFAQKYKDLNDEGIDDETSDKIENKIGKDPKLSQYKKSLDDTFEYGSSIMDEVEKQYKDPKNPSDAIALNEIKNVLNNIDLLGIIASLPEGADPIVEISKSILDGVTSDRAREILREILEEKLGDVAQANGLGVIRGGDGNGAGGNGEDGNGGNGGGGNISKFDHYTEIIKKTMDINDTLLNNLINGDYSAPEFQDMDINDLNKLSALASEQMERLRDLYGLNNEDEDPAVVHDQLDEKPSTDPRKIAAHKQFFQMDSTTINGVPFTVYDTFEAKKGKKVPYDKKDMHVGTKATLKWMREHNVQDFIDSGALAYLERAYRDGTIKSKDGRLPIYFVANPHYQPNNIVNNPFATESKSKKHPVSCEVLLAIEMNDENRSYLSDYEKNNVFNNDTLLTIQDGESEVKYQVIGEVWNPDPKDLDKKVKDGQISPEERDKYINEVKPEAQKIWNHAIDDSIMPQCRSDKTMFDENGKWYVAKIHPAGDTRETDTHPADYTTGERLYTTLNYMMSGRNETREKNSKEYKKIPLKTSMQRYNSYGGEHEFYMQLRGDSISSDGLSKLPSSINAPAGSIWMSTTEANGERAWTYITVPHADPQEYDFSAYKDTELISEINEAIDRVLKPVPQSMSKDDYRIDAQERNAACKFLHDKFYLGVGNTITFLYGNEYIDGLTMVVGGMACKSREDVYRALGSIGARFQVLKSDIVDPKAMQRLIDAGVLRSEMIDFVRFNSSFGVNFLIDQDSDGNKVDPYPRKDSRDFARTSGSNMSTAMMVPGAKDGMSNIRIGNAGYKLNTNTGEVTRMTAGVGKGEVITDPTTVAEVKALAELIPMRDAQRAAASSAKMVGGNVSSAFDGYPGDRWILNTKGFQHTIFFEREIDRIKVHLMCQGVNGDISIVYSDSLWNNFMQAATPVQRIITNPGRDNQEPTAEEQRAAQDEFDRVRAAEEGGAPAPKRGPKMTVPGRKGGRKSAVGRKLDIDDPETVQEKDKSDSSKNAKSNCDDQTPKV